MTQAFNLSQLANNLNSSGQLDATDGLNGLVPIANGGTNASTASSARTNLGVAISSDVMPWVAPSTAGNVLTSNGSVWTSSAPSGGGGSYVYLSTANASTSVVDFTGLDFATYPSYAIKCTDVRGSGSFTARFFIGGALNTTTNYWYGGAKANWTNAGVGAFGNSGAAIQGFIINDVLLTTANYGITGWVWVYGAGGYSNFQAMTNTVNSSGTGATSQIVVSGGYLNNTTQCDGIRFMGGSFGNLTAGEFKLYGIKGS